MGRGSGAMMFLKRIHRSQQRLSLILLVATCLLLVHFIGAQQDDDNDFTLLEGGIVTRTNVQEYADLSWDLRDMRTYQNDPVRLQNLYEFGSHAQRNGKPITLKSLSEEFAQDNIVLTPHYINHIYGLTINTPPQTSLEDRLSTSQRYASEYVTDVLKSPNPENTAEAVLVLVVWMYATHVLYRGVYICQERTVADNPDVVDALGGGGLDEFIALWIGRDQTPGSNSGHSLYAWTQQIGDYFGMNSPESKVNSKIKLLYQQGAAALAMPNACTKQQDQTVQLLWNIVTQITTEMMKPLFQYFMYHLTYENHGILDIYSQALFPQISKCRPSLYKYLVDNLLVVRMEDKNEIMAKLHDALQCFGIRCSDIIKGDAKTAIQCQDGNFPKLAGFQTLSDVSALSRLDVDIRQLRVFWTMESETFADMLYRFGSNVPKPVDSSSDPFELISLQALATRSDRTEAPMYQYFLKYFDSRNYADQLFMLPVLKISSKWQFRQQQTEALVLIGAFMIVYMEMIRQLSDVVQQCPGVDPDIGFTAESAADRHPLDNAAALLIGSMEGSSLGGSVDRQDGEFVWSLANRRAFQFQTMNTENYATVNDDLIDLLYAAQGQLDAGACTTLSHTVGRIIQLTQVGIIQSILMAASVSQDIGLDSDHVSLVQTELLSKAILPIIDAHDEATAQLILENTEIKSGVDTVRDGAQALADGFGFYIFNGAKLRCDYVGHTSDVNPCAMYGDISFSGTLSRNPLAWIVFVVSGLLLL